MNMNEKLAVLRRQKGLTQDELALEVGVTRQAVSKWERGVIAPSTVNLIALGRLYGIPLDELVNGGPQFEEPPKTPDVPPAPKKRGMKIVGGIALAVCLLLATIASVITIWTAVFKEPDKPENGVVRTDDMEPEYIDLEELAPFNGTWEIME